MKAPIQSTITSLILVGLFLSAAASAQDFTLNWLTMDGGGGTSRGGAYTISGTIGQFDAGPSSGGPFVIHGGFWLPDPPACACSLTQLRDKDHIILSWSDCCAGCVLESCTDLRGREGTTEWTPVAPAPTGNSYTISMHEPRRFFRLRCP